MASQRKQHYQAIPYVRGHYDRLCKKHGHVPSPADVDAIEHVIGKVSNQVKRFEPGLLFFLSRSAVQFEFDMLLVGWSYLSTGYKHKVWFRPSATGRKLSSLPGGFLGSMYDLGDRVCDEWHPVISDLVNPTKNANRALQYAYLRACIKIPEATVPPPSIENLQPLLHSSASPNSTPIVPSSDDEEVEIQRGPTAVPISTFPSNSTICMGIVRS